ncbi:MAG: carboxypeptidase regulatory-like domain-containing protein [Hyalangium sp.]|uniref:carboxypeptidase regulatory-like domain-containing protein n=1 Tax=Hyalangium sp. TaxID=2028555 RepID=UPI00389A9917
MLGRRRMMLGVGALVLVGGVLGLFLLRAHEPSGKSGASRTATASDADSDSDSSPQAPVVAMGMPYAASPAPTEPVRQLPRVTLERSASASAGAFLGRIVSATTGEGIRGAEVTLAGARGAASLVTDAEGRFEFRPSAPGMYQVAAIRADGFLPFGPEWGRSPIALSAVQGLLVREVVIALTPTQELVGLVLSASGAPIPGATVRMLTSRAGETVLFPVKDRFTTDEHGEFRFTAPEGAQVEARHPAHGVARARIYDENLASHRVELRMPAEAAESARTEARVEGRVLAPDGTGAAGALVSVMSAASAYPQEYGTRDGYQAVAEADGSFVVEGLEPGLYDVSASAVGFAPGRAFDVRVPASGVTLRLSGGVTLAGLVMEQAGTAVPAFVVDVMTRYGPLERLSFAQARFIDAEGHFEFRGLTPGRYVVQVSAAGFVPTERDVEVTEGAQEVRADVTLTRGARLEGTVLSAGTRVPIAGARVAVEGLMATDALAPLFDAVSGADGTFSLEGIPGTGVTLTASAPGYNGRLLSAIRPGVPVVIELTATEPDAGPKVEFVGIGAVLKARGDALIVGEVVPGGGAQAAGLVPGDELVRIEGTPVTELGFVGAVQRIRGPEGTQVLIGVRKSGQSSVRDISVPRKKIGV